MNVKQIIIIVLLLVGLGCEPYGGGAGYQYLGRVDGISFNCDAQGKYTTIVTVYLDIFAVVGKIDIPGKSDAYVWFSSAGNTLLLRGLNNICAEHSIILRKTMHLPEDVGK